MYDLDPNAYGDLYYSVNPQYIPSIGSAIGGVESMSLWGWGNGFAEWRTDPGAVRIWDDLANAYRAYTGQFIMRVNETAANGGAAAPAIAPGANGIIPASAGPSFVIGNDEFDTNWQFLLNGVPAGVIFDSIPTSPNDELRTSVGSTFWWNAPVQGVPEPGTMALAVLGLGGLVLVRRRRRA